MEVTMATIIYEESDNSVNDDYHGDYTPATVMEFKMCVDEKVHLLLTCKTIEGPREYDVYRSDAWGEGGLDPDEQPVGNPFTREKETYSVIGACDGTCKRPQVNLTRRVHKLVEMFLETGTRRTYAHSELAHPELPKVKPDRNRRLPAEVEEKSESQTTTSEHKRSWLSDDDDF